jgi:hypothetical protein
MATSNHIPSAQPVNEAIPATKAVLAAQAGVEPAKLPASRPAITATGSATKAKPLALPSANRHHAAKVSSLPDTAASVTTVASATAVVMVQRQPTQTTAHAESVHPPSVSRDRDVSTIRAHTA